MPYYALVVVLDGDDPDSAWDEVSRATGDNLAFIGDAWEVEDRTEQADYSTDGVILQRPRPETTAESIARVNREAVENNERIFGGEWDER